MANCFIYFRVLIQLIVIELHLKIGFATNPYLTLLNIKSAFSNNGQYQCYPTDPSTVITFGKVFRIADSDSLAEETGIDQGAFAGARRLIIPPSDGNFFGVYYCKGVLNGEETTLYTSIVDLNNAENSIVTPTNGKITITASVGESVSVSFTVDSSATGNHIWRKDGDLLENYEDMYDQSSLDLQNVGIDDAGVYELYIGESSRLQYQHSFIELIVKVCAADRWGPQCTGICNNCYNGGVCDDKTGGCICAPGFRGTNCEITCGANRFGGNCEIQCTRRPNSPTACRNNHYCLPKPFGCDCVTGYRGLKCNLNCLADTFGSSCSQQCHCQSGGCDQYTGECDSGGCAAGWSGTNCQVPDICPVGYYGPSCTFICHCLNNVECDKDTGACSNGECARGYQTYDNAFCEECVTGSYGLSCALTCNCQDSSCHHETGCNGGCYSNWLPNFCTTGIISTNNDQVNPDQSSTFQCDIQGDVTDVVVQLIVGTEPVDEFQRSESNGITSVSFSAKANMGLSYSFTITKNLQSASRDHTVNLFSLPAYYGMPTFGVITGSTMEVSWREWNKEEGDTGDSPIVGYFVYHKTTSTDWSKSTQVTETKLTVTGLEWETQYSFSVSAVREGAGGEGSIKTFASMSTICGEPLPPNVDVQTRLNSPKQIDVSWQPLTINEAKCKTGVEAYTVSYWPTNDRSNASTVVETSTLYMIRQLQVYTEYTITVIASNKDFAGEVSTVQQYSPEEKPPAPDVRATHEGTYLEVHVVPSESYGLNLYGNIINYELRYKSSGEWMNETITKDQGSKGHKITNAEKTDYEVSARVVNGAGAGNWSNSKIIQNSPNTGDPPDSNADVIGSVIGILLLICIIVILVGFLLRRRQRLPKHESTYANHHQESSLSDYNNKYQSTEYLSPAVEKPKDEITTPELEKKAGRKSFIPQLPDDFDEDMYQNVESLRPINVKDLPDFVTKKRVNPLDGLQHEYGKLPKGQIHPWTVASRHANRTKNRFKNIVAYDHSRVVLEAYEDDPESGYINACYVDGYKRNNKYIASQGPNNASLIDFWRMIWQENVTTIVMLTNIIESGKEKCKKYWPDDRGHVAEFGEISILLEVTESYADYKIRSFKVWKEDDVDFRRIKQYHFTSWPDMGVPLYATAALNFHKKIKSDNISTSAPLLVHCSAGVGRTGTFVCIDSMMEMIDKEQKIDVFNFVKNIRNQRINMVQTPEQYVFIYDALLEYSLCGDTTMNTNNFQARLSKLKHLIPQTNKTYIEEEFEILQHVTPYPMADYCKAGHLQENFKKNRVSNIIPIDRSRPFLVTESSSGGNEYINASFVDGYKQKDKFIVTQMPLPNTVEDMWRLFFDWNVRSVVMLNEMDPNDDTCAQYWTDENGSTMQFGPLLVTLKSVKRKGNLTVREFSITSENKRGQDPSVVHMYQVHGWAVNQDVPEEPDTLLQVLELVNNNQHDYHHGNHPVVVHCINGIGRSGIYCTIVEVVERMKMENVIDVFQTVKKLRSNRPGLVQNVDQYIFCYDIISSYLGGFDTYANPNA